MKKVILVCFLVSYIGSVGAQTYNLAGGIRLGTELGFSLKYRVADKLTVEGIIQSPIRENVAIVTLLVEKHNSILTKGLNIYVGGGVQKGWVLDEVKEFEDPFGIVGIVGAEFNFAKLNLSYDIKPAVNLIGGSRSLSLQTGITVRYIFDKREFAIIDQKAKAKRKKKRFKEKEKKKRFKQKIKDKYEKKRTPFWKNGSNID